MIRKLYGITSVRASLVRAYLTIALLACTLGVGAYRTAELESKELGVVAAHPNWSYHDKMSRKFGPFYSLMRFVRQHTRPDSTIVIPPSQDPWRAAGNEFLVRSFLYPRTLVRGMDNLSPEHPRTRTYILIATGVNGEVWPANPPETATYLRPGWGVIYLGKR